MQHIGAQRVGYGLCTVHIGNAQKGVVGLHEPDALALERPGHGAVAIAVELQAERCPGRDPEVAQPEFVIDEVEVVVQTLARLGAQVGLAAALVVPRLVARAGLHRRDDVHQPGCMPRACSTRATKSSLRMWLLLTCSISMPAATQTSCERTRMRSRSGSANLA